VTAIDLEIQENPWKIGGTGERLLAYGEACSFIGRKGRRGGAKKIAHFTPVEMARKQESCSAFEAPKRLAEADRSPVDAFAGLQCIKALNSDPFPTQVARSLVWSSEQESHLVNGW